MFSKRRYCTLVITHRCNLNCIYCYEHNKDLQAMTFAKAKEILLQEFSYVSSSSEYDELEIDFMGGEPLVEFSLIRQVCEWLWAEERQCPYICFATTNGTLLNEESKKWFISNKHRIKLGLSFDGTNDMQNTNRSNSASLIDLDFFRENFSDQSVKMTVSPETVDSMAEGYFYLKKRGFIVSPSFAYGVKWTSDKIEIYQRELKKIAHFFIENSDCKLPEVLDKKISVFFSDYHSKGCGTGTSMATYDINGLKVPCQMFLTISGVSQGKVPKFEEGCSYIDDRCTDCSYKAFCFTCYGTNFLENGDVRVRTPMYCWLKRVEIATAIWLKSKLIVRKIDEGVPLSEEDKWEAKAIVAINATRPKKLSLIPAGFKKG